MVDNLETKVEQRDTVQVTKELESSKAERTIVIAFTGLFAAMGTKYLLQDSYFLGYETDIPSYICYALSLFSGYGAYRGHRRIKNLKKELSNLE